MLLLQREAQVNVYMGEAGAWRERHTSHPECAFSTVPIMVALLFICDPSLQPRLSQSSHTSFDLRAVRHGVPLPLPHETVSP